MATTILLLSDAVVDVRELLPQFPVSPYLVSHAPLKATRPEDLIPIHPDLLLIDATTDIETAEDATRRLSLAWETGLPPILVVVDDDSIGRFRYEVGADDLLMRSASTGEISARLALAARRAGRGEEATVIKVGDLTVNPDNYQVYVRGNPLDLTYKEFELLRFLAEHPGRVFTRAKLLQEVWGYDFYGGTRTVDVHVRRLRAKLGPAHEYLIETVRGVGYRAVDG